MMKQITRGLVPRAATLLLLSATASASSVHLKGATTPNHRSRQRTDPDRRRRPFRTGQRRRPRHPHRDRRRHLDVHQPGRQPVTGQNPAPITVSGSQRSPSRNQERRTPFGVETVAPPTIIAGAPTARTRTGPKRSTTSPSPQQRSSSNNPSGPPCSPSAAAWPRQPPTAHARRRRELHPELKPSFLRRARSVTAGRSRQQRRCSAGSPFPTPSTVVARLTGATAPSTHGGQVGLGWCAPEAIDETLILVEEPALGELAVRAPCTGRVGARPWSARRRPHGR